jgi:hypothetical protein
VSDLEQHINAWLPTQFHGEIVLLPGGDPETTIVAALKRLMPSGQIPNYTTIKYMIKTDVVTADEEKTSINKTETHTLFFELLP